jgi:DNA-directed RNA polymerase subunit beta
MEKKAFLTTLPDFIEIQRASFCWFLEKGLSEELNKFSLITTLYKSIEINFLSQEYKIKKPKYDVFESKKRNISYSIKLYVPISLKIYNQNFTKPVYIFIGEIPLMSERGTFILNGYERVIVNQIIRSPGIYYKEELKKNGNSLYSATIIPNRGSWVNFMIDKQKNLTFNIDKSDKINIEEFFYTLGLNLNQIPKNFLKYNNDNVKNYSHSENLELQKIFASRLFNSKYYEFGKIGRYKLNNRFNLNISKFVNDLTIQDIIIIIEELINLDESNIGKIDDIDHLENRRVRSVGELLQTQICSGLTKLERIAVERVKICNPHVLKLNTIFNEKSINSVMREFFGSSQLSQFLDQTNPISELTHRRRISGLGPGGFSREHVNLLVRDIHPSHYGRICPIETPEGQNAGLISSLAIYARINSFGFIETPFFKVKNGIILKQSIPIYLTAEEEDKLKIASADIKIHKDGKILEEFVTVRYMNEFIQILSKEVQLISVSPIQIISSATALIPFLEHDDANRALMGANMQRQAVPLLYPTKAIIGTGLESQLATDAGIVVISYTNGYVNQVTSEYIIITNYQKKNIYYSLQKYIRSNQDTCINQRPIVWNGEYVKSGQIIADGPGTENGEIALGQNITIAYMPWEGFNYEDALLVSERLIYADLFTSLHIEKYDLEVKQTKAGLERLTKDLPYISSKYTKNLDSNGIILKGYFVRAGDILVGKITPNEEIDLIPEERLLIAIFGEKKINVTENSLRVPTGSYGRVLDIRIFSRENGDDLPFSTDSIVRIFLAQIRKIQIGDKMAGRHGNKGIISKILPREDMPYLPNGKPIDLILNPLGVPSRMNVGQLFEGLFGFAGDILDKRFKIIPFDEMFEIEASRILINNALIKARKKKDQKWVYNRFFPGKILLRDGRTGEHFENPITICKSYIFKLIHLVDDKIHARSTGPYSLITQQPLGGKSQQGGQRFGEMEVWALEAFGAAYTLQEILTIKSDDINGRNNTLNAIIKGEPIPEPGIPESFKVLILELQSLCLDIGIYKIKKNIERKISEIELDIMADSNLKTLLPNYKSFEII